MSEDLSWATSAEIARGRRGQASALSVIDDALARIDERNPALGAFTAVTAERARARARSIDASATRPNCRSPACRSRSRTCSTSKALATIAGSKINRARPPAKRDSPLIERLEAAGAVLVGALNMGEYAYDFTGENMHDGPSRNPHDIDAHDRRLVRRLGRRGRRRPGAAGARLRHQRLDPRAVVAVRHFRTEADLRPALARALVSVRREPRSSRPVRALDPRSGALLRRHAGLDADDAVCADRPVEPATPLLERGLDGLRIAVAGGYFKKGAFPEALDALERVAKALGAATKSKSPKRRARAPRPMSSPPPKARRCISIVCASRRAISIRPCATA